MNKTHYMLQRLEAPNLDSDLRGEPHATNHQYPLRSLSQKIVCFSEQK